jgi:hypothetical protein
LSRIHKRADSNRDHGRDDGRDDINAGTRI